MIRTPFLVGLGGAVVMTGAVVWVMVAGVADPDWGELLRSPAYIATAIDVYIGLAFLLAWIAMRERSLARTLGWGLVLAATGNIGGGLYVAIAAARARGDLQRFMMGRRSDAPVN